MSDDRLVQARVEAERRYPHHGEDIGDAYGYGHFMDGWLAADANPKPGLDVALLASAWEQVCDAAGLDTDATAEEVIRDIGSEALNGVTDVVTYYMRPDSGAVDDGMLGDLTATLDQARGGHRTDANPKPHTITRASLRGAAMMIAHTRQDEIEAMLPGLLGIEVVDDE